MSNKRGCKTELESMNIELENEDIMSIEQYLIKCINYLNMDKMTYSVNDYIG